MCSRIACCASSTGRPGNCTRRTATVTISAPEASCAATITSGEGYLPVPTMRRERNVRPAIVRGVSIGCLRLVVAGLQAGTRHAGLETGAPSQG